jgi:hypothetical protein
MSVTAMSRLGRSVNADIVVIDGVTMGDGVVMGDGKFWEVGPCCSGCCVDWGLDWGLIRTAMGGDVDKSSLISLRLCVWLSGVVKVLQLKGV